MDTEHVSFVVVGVIIVLLVGQLLISQGRRYLATSAPREGRTAGPAATLFAVLFHLITLGVIALLAAIPMSGSTTQVFLIQIGVLLIVLAVIYGISLRMLGRQRDEALANEFEAQTARPADLGASVRVQPRVDYDNGEYGRREFGGGIPANTPMDPAVGTAMGQPEQDDAL